MPDRPVPWFEAPSMHVETVERSVSLAVLMVLMLMLITGLASSRRLGGPGEPIRRMCKYNTKPRSSRRPLLPCLEPMGIAGACANYFFDEFASVVAVVSARLLTCADGQNIGSVAAAACG
ncbi:hypothetical protein GCM10017687_83440 [Streptomyces echinatus]